MCFPTNDTNPMIRPSPSKDDYDSSIFELMIKFGGSVDSQGTPSISWTNIQRTLSSQGILVSDNRVRAFCDEIKSIKVLSYEQFRTAALQNIAFLKAIAEGQLTIQDFEVFSEKLQYLFENVESIEDGKTAQYIPTLRDADPNQYGLAFLSVQGQFFETGDSRNPFSIQSVSKPIMMSLALEQIGLDGLCKWVGVAPSGRAFNDSALLPDGRPFNPMVNAGAILTSAIVASLSPELCSDTPIGEEQEYAEELMHDVLLPAWNELSGNGAVGEIGFDRKTFLAERATGDTNFSLGHILRLKMGLPDPISLEQMMDFYFRSCSLEGTCATLSVVAATLANGGKCPVTGKQVMSSETVRNVLSSMVLSGMYDGAGDFYMKIGCPAKSGVSGCLMVIIPGVGGYCVFSPRIDEVGNSVRGVAFAEAVSSVFNFHAFDTVGSHCSKVDPRRTSSRNREISVEQLRWAISVGDKQATRFTSLLKWTGLYVTCVDAHGHDKKRKAIKNAYFAVTKSIITNKELDALSSRAGGMLDHDDEEPMERISDLLKMLKMNATSLPDYQKDFILEMAILVMESSSDDWNPSEWSIVHDICSALDVPTDVLPLKTLSSNVHLDLLANESSRRGA